MTGGAICRCRLISPDRRSKPRTALVLPILALARSQAFGPHSPISERCRMRSNRQPKLTVTFPREMRSRCPTVDSSALPVQARRLGFHTPRSLQLSRISACCDAHWNQVWAWPGDIGCSTPGQLLLLLPASRARASSGAPSPFRSGRGIATYQ